jgi:hypothetical protein
MADLTVAAGNLAFADKTRSGFWAAFSLLVSPHFSKNIISIYRYRWLAICWKSAVQGVSTKCALLVSRLCYWPVMVVGIPQNSQVERQVHPQGGEKRKKRYIWLNHSTLTWQWWSLTGRTWGRAWESPRPAGSFLSGSITSLALKLKTLVNDKIPKSPLRNLNLQVPILLYEQ